MAVQKIQFSGNEALELKAIAVLIQKASTFRSSISIMTNGGRVNAKSLLGMMALRIEPQMEVEVCAEGPDEQEALEAVVSYLQDPRV